MKPKIQSLVLPARSQLFALLLAASGLLAPWKAPAAGSFTSMTTPLPDSFIPGHMLLLSDGRVMVQDSSGNGWQFLTPDNQGHYVDGSWSTCPSMNYTREFYSSDILTNGHVFVAGGEDGNGTGTAEIFDPQGNGGAGAWTIINPPTSVLDPTALSPILENMDQGFYDSESVILSNGNVLIAPVGPNVQGGTLIYNPTLNAWSEGPTTISAYQDETSWAKLPDNSILTIDPFGTTCQRYIPSLNTWILDQTVPLNLWATNGEIGAALLLTNGTVFYVGGNNKSAIYTPSGGTNYGSWVQGPDMPDGLEMRDAPAAILVNGKVLLTLGPTTNDKPFTIFEYDPNNQSFTSVFEDSKEITDQTSMLDLPDGNVLFNDTYTVYVFQTDGSPVTAGKPAIQSVTYSSDGSVHLTGTLFNGISQGAMYGDDAQQDSNYPLVRFTDDNGIVTYGRTYNWSSTSVMTGSKVISTECTVPANVYDGPGSYSLQVVANGNASDPFTFYGPVWVDFNYSSSSPQLGTIDNPYSTLPQGVSAVVSGGTILIKPGSSAQTITITKPMTITSVGGSATIGN